MERPKPEVQPVMGRISAEGVVAIGLDVWRYVVAGWEQVQQLGVGS